MVPLRIVMCFVPVCFFGCSSSSSSCENKKVPRKVADVSVAFANDSSAGEQDFLEVPFVRIVLAHSETDVRHDSAEIYSHPSYKSEADNSSFSSTSDFLRLGAVIGQSQQRKIVLEEEYCQADLIKVDSYAYDSVYLEFFQGNSVSPFGTGRLTVGGADLVAKRPPLDFGVKVAGLAAIENGGHYVVNVSSSVATGLSEESSRTFACREENPDNDVANCLDLSLANWTGSVSRVQ